MTKEKSIDRPRKRRPQATKKNVRAICEAIATGSTIEEACSEIGITAREWRSWRERRIDIQLLHDAAMSARCDLYEDEIATAHDDLTDGNATNARVALRREQASNRKWFNAINRPERYSEKRIVGVQNLDQPEPEAARTIPSAERTLFAEIFRRMPNCLCSSGPRGSVSSRQMNQFLRRPLDLEPWFRLYLLPDFGHDLAWQW